jgi:hypothetical protein
VKGNCTGGSPVEFVRDCDRGERAIKAVEELFSRPGGRPRSGLLNKLPLDFVPAAKKSIDGQVDQFIYAIKLILTEPSRTSKRVVGFRGKPQQGSKLGSMPCNPTALYRVNKNYESCRPLTT